MNRTNIIQSLINKIDAKSYLEIGISNGENFNAIQCEYKVGVDPEPLSNPTFCLTSDEFFKDNTDTFDVIFIDGLHHSEQVYKDVINSLEVLNEGGYIVCHDMNPEKEEHQMVLFQGGTWNGDCWKAVVKLRQEREDLSIYTVDTDYGCSIIQRGSQDLLKITEEINYNNFNNNRKEWINLINIEEFCRMIGLNINELLVNYVNDPEDANNNFLLASYYENIGQTASALSYYLRCAERTEDDLLKYECLIRGSICFDKQGTRNFTVKGLLQHAISVLPKRPEAYYLLSRFYEKQTTDGNWVDSYMIASIGEKVCDFNQSSLKTEVGYPGDYGITFQKAVSSWWCGLCEDSKNIFICLLRNYEMDENHKNSCINNLKRMNYDFKLSPSIIIDEGKEKEIKVLLLDKKTKEDIWEFDYIVNDLLPDDFCKKIYFTPFSSIKNIEEETFDVFVYSCRDPKNYHWGHMPSYDEILTCVLKVKPKIIIQLSDEFIDENLQEHNNLGNYCDLFLRQYHHPQYEYTPNTIQLPLSYTNDCKVFKEDKSLIWSFFGEIKSNRNEMIDIFSELSPNFIENKSSKELMCKTYSQSIFVPCGRGNSSLNCFRLYEASMNGAIPIVVGPKEEIETTFKYEENPPWIFAETWNEAIIICKNLLEDTKKLEDLKEKVLNWWENRITNVQNKIKFILNVETNNYPFAVYTKNKYNFLGHKFPGSENIEQNYSEAYQDMFVLTMLNGKRNGTYLEIGAGNAFYGNNTALLEKDFEWKGVALDIDENFVRAHNEERTNRCLLKDATLIDYHKFLSGLDFPNEIDYLQLDCDPPGITYQILLNIPFDTYKFAVITYEHDYYCDESKSFQEKSRKYLESYGYVRVVNNISPDDFRPYEDWWVHPDLIDNKILNKMLYIDDTTKKAEKYILNL